MSDSIKVFARVRPLNTAENNSDRCVDVSREGKSLVVNAPQSTVSANQAAGFGAMMRGMPRANWGGQSTNTIGPMSPNNPQQHTFQFDHVYDSNTSQYLIYQQATAPLLDDLMAGYNTVIMAYGQTGSGKTYTMTGSGAKDVPVSPTSDHGIIPRFINGIFDHIEESDETIEFTIKVSVIEIYMEKIKDLLSGQDGLRIRDNSSSVWIEDLTQVYVTSIDEVFAVIETGQSARSVASTMMNDSSSRSHLIVQITIGQHFSTTGEKRGSQLTFVDLAGSEKVAKTLAEGQTLKEAQYINKSLSALGNVINACSAKLPHVPYRDSKLTHLLRDSIAGNSKTALIIACSPSGNQYDETMSTCRFGQRAATIQNKPIMNRERSIEEYKSLFLSAFRLVVRRTSLLAASHHVIGQCVKEHSPLIEHNDKDNNNNMSADLRIEPEVIQRVYLETNPSLQLQHFTNLPQIKKIINPKELKEQETRNSFFIQPSIVDALREICSVENDGDILAFLGGEIISSLTNTITQGDGDDGSFFTLDPSQSYEPNNKGHHDDVNNSTSTLYSNNNKKNNIPAANTTNNNITTSTSNNDNNNNNNNNQDCNNSNNNNKPKSPHDDKLNTLFHEDEDLRGLSGDEQFKAKLQMYQERLAKTIGAMKSLETQHGLQVLSLANDIEAKEQDIIRLRTEVTDSYIHQQSLQNEIQSLQTDITNLQATRDRQNEKVEQLNAQLEKFTGLLKQKDITIKSLCDENNTRQEQQLKYESQLIQRVEKSRFILEQKESLIKSLNENQSTSTQDLSTLQQQYNTLNQSMGDAEVVLEQLKLDHQAQVMELKGKLEQYLTYKDTMVKKDLECNILTEQTTLLQQSVEQLKDSVTRLGQQNLKYEEELTLLRAENKVFHAQNSPHSTDKVLINDLQCQNIEMQKSLTTVSNDYQAAKNNLLELGEKYRALNLKLQQSEKDYKIISNRLHDMDMQLNDRTQRMTSFETELNQTKKSHAEVLMAKQHIQQEFNSLTEKLSKQQLLYDGLESQYSSSQTYCTTLKNEIESLTLKLAQLSHEAKESKDAAEAAEAIAATHSTIAEIDSAESKLLHSQQHLMEMTNQRDNIMHELTISKQQIAALEKSLVDTHQLFTETQDQHLLLEQQFQNLTKKYKKLEDNSKDRFLELEKEKHMVRYQYTKLQEEYTAMQRSMNENTIRLEQNNEVIQQLSTKNKELTTKNEMLLLRFDTTVNDTTQQITDLETSKSELVSYKETTQREIGELTTKNVALQQEVLNYKSKFVLLESNLQILQQQSQTTITDLREQLTKIQADNTSLKANLTNVKSLTSTEVSTSNEKYNTLHQQFTEKSTQHTLLTTELNEMKIKYTEEKQMAMKQVTSLQRDLQQQIELHKTWQSQQESLYQEKCNAFQVTIAKNEQDIDQLREEINLNKVEQDNIKRQTSLNLSEQNKYHSQELIILREQHHQELKLVNSERNRYLSEKTEAEQNCLALQDLNNIQQQELMTLDAAKQRLDDKISNLQIQWEQNINQQMDYEELMQSKLDALEKILAYHGIPVSTNSDGAYIVPIAPMADDPRSPGAIPQVKQDKGFFTKFKGNEKNDGAKNSEVIAQLRIELKQAQVDLDEKKIFMEKKEKQFQRVNTSFLQKCKDHDELLKEIDTLKGKMEDAKYEMQQLEVLFEDPLEIVALREENKTLNTKVKQLTDANKSLLMNEYSSRKKHGNIVAPGGSTTFGQQYKGEGNHLLSNSTPGQDPPPLLSSNTHDLNLNELDSSPLSQSSPRRNHNNNNHNNHNNGRDNGMNKFF